MSDIVEDEEVQAHPDRVAERPRFYNGTTKQRGFYLVPIKQATCHSISGAMVDKAGFKLADAPKTWDAFWDFFKPMQKELRAKGMRKIYAMGLQTTTVGPNDGNNPFHHFLIANGGQDIVTQGRQAAYRRSQGPRGGDQVGRVHDELLQGRLRAAGGADLERRRRQQRLSTRSCS